MFGKWNLKLLSFLLAYAGIKEYLSYLASSKDNFTPF